MMFVVRAGADNEPTISAKMQLPARRRREKSKRRRKRRLVNAASSEGRPILARCNSQAPPERAPERLRTSEAAGIRDFIESQCRQFKLTSRSFETKVLNVLRRCFAHFL